MTLIERIAQAIVECGEAHPFPSPERVALAALRAIRAHLKDEHSEPALRAACYSFYNREGSPAAMLSTDDLRKGFLAQIDAALSEADRDGDRTLTVDAIPEDIREKAIALAHRWAPTYEAAELARVVAAALLAERERCAQILVNHFAPNQGESVDPQAVAALAAIRSQGQK